MSPVKEKQPKKSWRSFSRTLGQPLRSKKIEIFQMNVGKLCNLSCSHCHVDAGPTKLAENMRRETF